MRMPLVPARHRRGITLTEILISILIMGVGMLSLATLFPLGLERIRQANRSSRSALLFATARDEIKARDLLSRPSFLATYYPYDPFTRDPSNPANPAAVDYSTYPYYGVGTDGGLDRVHPNPNAVPAASPLGYPGGPGLPVCYDPLWWYQLYYSAGNITPASQLGNDPLRFGYGLNTIRSDPFDGGTPSAHGLQRISNIFPTSVTFRGSLTIPGTDVTGIAASPDDIVMQQDGVADVFKGRGSPVVNDLSTSATLQDLSYTWMLTGYQQAASAATSFDGSLVVFQNRPFAIDNSPVNPSSTSTSTLRVAGETVVEAIYGYGVGVNSPATGPYPYSLNESTVLLRWHSSQPDPDVRVGGWIADVTYERNAATEDARWYPRDGSGNSLWYNPSPFRAQRCYWYRVAKRTEPTQDHDPSLSGSYREMVVTIEGTVKAKTPMNSGAATNARINVALISPYVVNVFPWQFNL